ncbi:MAG: pyruvate ferredoxin oxidoreductase [Deltaproteobacteria bacterium]|nr:pyruvate ferredoxin oxidoreductase [Deltaproteobacteria bacterium]
MSVVEGSEAVAMAIKACRPQVVSAYPISPQTHIVENLAKMVADGELDAQYVRVESEFSAASVVSGASATGSRAYTASSSQGLLLMTEVIYASAGMRLPFVITGVNRTISAPISIQVDHQDTMSLRDSGIIQLYVESVQEAYDTHIAAFKIAEDPKISLPVMVCMDGWILTHSYESVAYMGQEEIDRFLSPFEPEHFLDIKNPKSWGSYADDNVLMEFKYAVHQAMQDGKQRIREIFKELSLLTGRDYRGLVEAYRTEDADTIVIALGSVSGTVKESVDDLRSEGHQIGMVKIRCYRPFPFEDIWEAIKGARRIAVLDANISMGSEGAVGMDLKAKLYGLKNAPLLVDFIAGLGGREINKRALRNILQQLDTVGKKPPFLKEPNWVGLNPTLFP